MSGAALRSVDINSIPEATPRVAAKVQQAPKASNGAFLVGVISVVAIISGFMLRDTEIIVPKEGLGYYLGLSGGLIMVALLLYPAVKRTRLFGNGSKSPWLFKFHMLLGIIGPLAIFYHTNFSLGALNSNIALFAMILVAGSGVVGRYIYVHVYAGLSGARLDVGSLLSQATRLMAGIEEDVGGSSGLVSAALSNFSSKATPKSVNLASSLKNAAVMPFLVAAARKRIMQEANRAIAQNAAQKGWSRSEVKVHKGAAKAHVNEFLIAVSRAAQLAFWERMFSLWHVLHVPLFFLLLVSGVIHVVAVHLY